MNSDPEEEFEPLDFQAGEDAIASPDDLGDTPEFSDDGAGALEAEIVADDGFPSEAGEGRLAKSGFSGGAGEKPDRRRKAVLGVPIEVVVTVGRARPLLSELVGLKRDSVLPLDSKLADPVEIVIGDRVIARGELQELDPETGRLGVRLTEVADLSQTI